MAGCTRSWLALGTVYLVWGSTYLGVMVGIRTMPPLLMSSLRFGLAGALLRLLDPPRRSAGRPARRHAVVRGGGGRGPAARARCGGIAWAEQRVPSGLTALIVACVPLFVAVLEWLTSGRRLGPWAPSG